MTQQTNDPDTVARASAATNAPASTAELTRNGQMLTEMTASVAVLRTEADRARSVFGFGRRILVPPDEIHVVVGHGRHIFAAATDRAVFGSTAERPSRYWLNPLTQVIKLKTISFTVAIHGGHDSGVPALDASKVSFLLWAHAVAKLNPDKAEIAAQRVGLDTTGLINTITKVGTAELVAAAATMGMEEIIANRQRLAEIAFPKVNQILSELGYDLALLTVTRLDGDAYLKLIRQAESRISKETTVATNREQLAELGDDQAREQQEAEVRATTEKKLAGERLDAEREVTTATIEQREALAVRRHEKELLQIGRDKAAASASHDTDLAKVALAQKLAQAETSKEADILRLRTEREAELRALQQKRTAVIKLAETEAEALRLALDQAKGIERNAALTLAEAERLQREELAKAERTREVAMVEAQQLADAMKVEADGEARSLQIRVDAQSKTELIKAEAEATATEKRAEAAKIRAEATRAETAAPGLAEVQVEEARVAVAEKQVVVTRAEGIAAAEVARAQADADAERMQRLREIEINAQDKLSRLYEQAPVLVDLEKLRLEHAHQARLAEIRAEASLRAIEAIAPGVRINLFGSGGQSGQIMNSLMSVVHGLDVAGEALPWLSGRLNGAGNGRVVDGDDSAATITPVLDSLRRIAPYVRQVLAGTNPRVLSSLRVADLIERLEGVAIGDESLAGAITSLREDTNFRLIGDLPVAPLLGWLGLPLAPAEGNDADLEEIALVS